MQSVRHIAISCAILAWAGFVLPSHGTGGDADIVAPTETFAKAEKYEAMQGGATTSRKRINKDAFSHPSANLTFAQELDFRVGNAMFRRLWVTAPASTKSSDGLGPLFNARSCQRCHLKDGRGHPPNPAGLNDNAVSMLLRLSIPPESKQQREAIAQGRLGTVAEPTYGKQLHDFSIPGVQPDGRMVISYEPVVIELGDGTEITLRKPHYSVANLSRGPLHPETMLSPRIAPPMIGMGLLEMIKDADLIANADPEDQDENGISGRIRWVWDMQTNARAIGRFGWKAENPTIRQQSGHAFGDDIGISNPVSPAHWGDCTEHQHDCRLAPHGISADDGPHEASEEVLRLVTFYSRNLAVPKRRKVTDPQILHGKKLFYQAECTACHMPKFITRTDSERMEHSRQLIWPYSDLLLHDMGEGLADGRPEGNASGREWRTPPLWGIGLTEIVSGHSFFLHDGRARNLQEAILWHGGEAEASKERFRLMTEKEREALLAFLKSL
ncbi:MAG: di-heme oxidoredictase family protein [Pseudomonadota bacterium]